MTTTDQPIVAGWLRSGSEFSDTTYKLLRRTAHRSTFHGSRGPLYALRLLAMAPRGLLRTLRTLGRLVFDTNRWRRGSSTACGARKLRHEL
jgi:hypothetical protein